MRGVRPIVPRTFSWMGIKENDEGKIGKPQALVGVNSLYGRGGFSVVDPWGIEN